MSSRVFTAEYSGSECPVCGDRIHAGEEVRFNDDGELEHFSCQPVLDPGKPCPHCFLIHTGECF